MTTAEFIDILDKHGCAYETDEYGDIKAYVPCVSTKYWKVLAGMPDYATVLVPCTNIRDADYIRLTAKLDTHDTDTDTTVVDTRCVHGKVLMRRSSMRLSFGHDFSVRKDRFMSKALYLQTVKYFRDKLNDILEAASYATDGPIAAEVDAAIAQAMGNAASVGSVR